LTEDENIEIVIPIIRDLGIIIDDNLKFEEHISCMSANFTAAALQMGMNLKKRVNVE
jgi:hypothetical protein